MRSIVTCLIALGACVGADTIWARADIEIADADHFFRESGVSGSVTAYDPAADTWYYTDSADADKPNSPASTFKIVNSLILLQEAVVSGADESIPWDGVARTLGGDPYPAWNRNHTLATAFRDSAVWVYEVLSEQVERDVYRQWLSQIGYGNDALDEPNPLFWLRGDFAVTPRQQILTLYDLYRETLPFDVQHQRAVTEMMASPPSEHVRNVAGKTGLVTQNGQDIGWWCGWLEIGDPTVPEAPPRLFFFATRLVRDAGPFDPHFAALRQSLTYQVIDAILTAESLAGSRTMRGQALIGGGEPGEDFGTDVPGGSGEDDHDAEK